MTYKSQAYKKPDYHHPPSGPSPRSGSRSSPPPPLTPPNSDDPDCLQGQGLAILVKCSLLQRGVEALTGLFFLTPQKRAAPAA